MIDVLPDLYLDHRHPAWAPLEQAGHIRYHPATVTAHVATRACVRIDAPNVPEVEWFFRQLRDGQVKGAA